MTNFKKLDKLKVQNVEFFFFSFIFMNYAMFSFYFFHLPIPIGKCNKKFFFLIIIIIIQADDASIAYAYCNFVIFSLNIIRKKGQS